MHYLRELCDHVEVRERLLGQLSSFFTKSAEATLFTGKEIDGTMLILYNNRNRIPHILTELTKRTELYHVK